MPSTLAPVPTLRALLARPDLQLRLEGDESALADGSLDSTLRWVHSSDLVDPTPFLSEGLVLLTTGTQFTDADASECVPYVRRLRTRGVAALGFGTEVAREGVPPALVDACRALQMPLFEVPYRTPFIAVARANAEAIAAEAYARRSWALAAQRAISLAALRPDGLGASVAELSRQLGTWVGLFDNAGSLARSHPVPGLTGAHLALLSAEVLAVLRGGARAASAISLDGAPFTLQTLGRGGHLRGVLAIASGGLDHDARAVVTSVIAMVGLALEQNHDLARAREVLRSGLLQALLGDAPTLARRVAKAMWGSLPRPPLVVGVTAPLGRRADAVTAHLELLADEHHGGVFFGRMDEGIVVCVGADGAPLLHELAAAFELPLGVSNPAGYESFARAHGEAVAALAATRAPARSDAGDTGVSLVRRFADLAGAGLFGAITDTAAVAAARSMLSPLESHDAATGSDLEHTVRVWLQNDARGDAAASALGIHRHTVRARIAQVEALLGVDLRTFAHRADLWAALQLARRGP